MALPGGCLFGRNVGNPGYSVYAQCRVLGPAGTTHKEQGAWLKLSSRITTRRVVLLSVAAEEQSQDVKTSVVVKPSCSLTDDESAGMRRDSMGNPPIFS